MLIYNSLALINQGIRQNSKYIIIPFNLDIYNLCVFLYKHGWISQFYNINNKRIIIYYKYIANKPIMNSLTIISKPGYKHKNKLIYFKKNIFKNIYKSEIVFKTNKGFFSIKESIRNNISGKILFRIN
jgi:ribosomal protein S8